MKRRSRKKTRKKSTGSAKVFGGLILCGLCILVGALKGQEVLGFVRGAREASHAAAGHLLSPGKQGDHTAAHAFGVEEVPAQPERGSATNSEKTGKIISGKPVTGSQTSGTTRPGETVSGGWGPRLSGNASSASMQEDGLHGMSPASLAVVLDDFGPNLAVAEAALDLDFPVTVAILPGYAFSGEIARRARARGVEILLHQPMETEKAGKLPGPGTLYTWMTRERMKETLDENLSSLGKLASGVNNHMGSGFTADPKAMTLFLKELQRRKLFFLDSVTTGDSAAVEAARGIGMNIASRTVFLDDADDPVSMGERWRQALRRARGGTPMVVIGHGRWETVRFLRDMDRNEISVDFCILSDMIPASAPGTAWKSGNVAVPLGGG